MYEVLLCIGLDRNNHPFPPTPLIGKRLQFHTPKQEIPDIKLASVLAETAPISGIFLSAQPAGILALILYQKSPLPWKEASQDRYLGSKAQKLPSWQTSHLRQENGSGWTRGASPSDVDQGAPKWGKESPSFPGGGGGGKQRWGLETDHTLRKDKSIKTEIFLSLLQALLLSVLPPRVVKMTR